MKSAVLSREVVNTKQGSFLFQGNETSHLTNRREYTFFFPAYACLAHNYQSRKSVLGIQFVNVGL